MEPDALLALPDNITFDQGAGNSNYLVKNMKTTKRHTGLYTTWPTSYEALVGRANLKAGMSMYGRRYALHPALLFQ